MRLRALWLMLGIVATGSGIAGTVLPLVPTTPFLLLAAYAFARSSPRLHAWLTGHPRFGPVIADWHRHGSIEPRLKLTAVAVMAATLALTWVMGFPVWVLGVQALVLAAVAAFILTRPDPPADGQGRTR